jgi:NADPH-dependent glutamate synthase beta subunit-like oxidoreductase
MDPVNMAHDNDLNESRLLTGSFALMSAVRCLGCHDAPCAHACPAGVDVPGFIRRFLDGNLQGAGALVYASCPLGATCGLACPTAKLCEGACVLQQTGQPPVPIGALQAYVCLQYTGVEKPARLAKAARVAVVGAGPAGLGCAAVLRRYGHQVDVYDRQEKPAGLIDRVIPAHRLPGNIVARDLAYLGSLDFHFIPGSVIDREAFERLRADYDAVFLGAGMGALQTAEFPGQTAEGVLNVLEFLEQARAGRPLLGSGQSVVILGGGNVALDAAVVARRAGAREVMVLYRRSRDEMPGWESEYLEAARLGAEFRWLSSVTAVEQAHGKVSAILVQKMRFSGEMRGGRRWVEADPDQAPVRLPCQVVIPALGQVVERGWLEQIGLDLSPGGNPLVDAATFQTSLPGVFAGGELVSGGSTIVNSLHQGMLAGDSLHAHLTGKGG